MKIYECQMAIGNAGIGKAQCLLSKLRQLQAANAQAIAPSFASKFVAGQDEMTCE
jgi:hypothetical protein